jgi:hypothetical protein
VWKRRRLKICYIALTLLAETCVNIQQNGGNGEVLVPLMSVVCNCQTDTKSTERNDYGQPQTVAERCDIAGPCHVVVAG